MENKLQELTDRLYREGLSKGKEEGEALVAKAEEKAAGIIDAAPLFLVGVFEGLKELKNKHLTWKKVIKNRLDVFATQMSFRDPKIW